MTGLRKVLLGAGLGAVVLGGTVWVFLDAHQGSGEEEAALPVPPAPPRLGEGPDYETCLAMLPDDPRGARAMAEAWLREGGGAPALHCLGLAEAALGDALEGAMRLEQAAAEASAPAASRAQVLDQALRARLMAGDTKAAHRDGEAALALSPDDPDLLVDQAVVAAALQRFDEALADLDHALLLDPSRSDALIYRASVHRERGEAAEASRDIEAALARDPDDPEALLERGIERQRAGDLAGARADWERVRALAPDSPSADLAEQNLALLDAGPAER